MNKIFALLLFISLTSTSWGQRRLYIAGYTRIEVGYPHAGSYQKERATFALEQSFISPINNHFAVGIGTGFALYPAAYTIPAFLVGSYRFRIFEKNISWDHRIGVNAKVGQNSFFGYRYNTTLHYPIRLNRKFSGYAGIGGNYLWDRWGGKSLSGSVNIGIVYSVFDGQKNQSKKGPPPPPDNGIW